MRIVFTELAKPVSSSICRFPGGENRFRDRYDGWNNRSHQSLFGNNNIELLVVPVAGHGFDALG